jgi:hypothetical protein
LTRCLIYTTVFILCAFVTLSAYPGEIKQYAVGVSQRTRGQNYKDSVLAKCVALIYQNHDAYLDAKGASDTAAWWAMRKGTSFDPQNPAWHHPPLDEAPNRLLDLISKSTEEADALIKQFVSREYIRPPRPRTKAESTYVPLNMLKCIDLYHSKELDMLMRKFVPNPEELPKEP